MDKWGFSVIVSFDHKYRENDKSGKKFTLS